MSHYQNRNWMEERWIQSPNNFFLWVGGVPVFTKYTCITYGSKVAAGSHVLMLPEPASVE